jgi:aminoglycoside/choline kinase family phosphotransferase
MFEQAFGVPVRVAEPVAAEGSKRRMLRLVGDGPTTAIGVLGPDREENRAFVLHARALRGAGLPVPEVFAVAPDDSSYLVEDLGDLTLFAALKAARRAAPDEPLPAAVRPAYERTLEALVRLQLDGGAAVDYRAAYPVAAFDATSIRWDLDAFKHQFLKLGGVACHEGRLERDVQRLIAHLLEADTSHFVFRDFQSRNVMLRDGPSPWFIDFQNGRRGALQYDVASMLFDGKAALAPEVRSGLLGHYLGALAERDPRAAQGFRRHFGGYVIVRILQAMSAYGYLGFYLRKAHFLESVPHAVRNLLWLLEHEPLLADLPEIATLIERIAADPRFAAPARPDAQPGLTVHVGSFSYKHGYPADPGGHGGGFVFDCRALPNPGREPAHAALSGLDRAVDALLAATPACTAFLDGAQRLVEAQVATYAERGFASLSVQFGCTGGQHRSVWCAERMADALRRHGKGVHVRVTHREREHWPATAGLDPVRPVAS